MPVVATIALVVFSIVTFVIRTWLQVRRTGETGFVGLRPGARPIERAAGTAMVIALVMTAVGIWIGEPVLPRAVIVPGLVLVVLGTAGAFASQLEMGDAWRIGVDPAARTELVTTGAFRWVRNPIFTMMIVASVGLALLCSTPLCLAAPIVLVAALEVQVRVVEEPWLLERHGEAYRAWASHTGRFVPRLGRLSRAGQHDSHARARP